MVKGLSVQENRLRGNNIYVYIYTYIFTQHVLVMYVYPLCFLIHTHTYTHKERNNSHCPNLLKGKTGCNPLSSQHRKSGFEYHQIIRL